MVAKIITVSTAAELQSALKGATGGETILLAAGTYGTLQLIDGKTPFDVTHGADAPVTIRSADADNPAVFTGLDLRDVSGFTFENLTFDYTYKVSDQITNTPFILSYSDDITIRGCTFDGDVAVNRNAIDDGRGFAKGFVAGNCSNLVFEGNTMFEFHRAAMFGGCNDVVVVGNDIHSIRSDGLNFASVQGLLVENNHLHDFNRALSSTDHADMIQFWTNGTRRPSTDIVIRGNTLDVGQGDGTQSIFMRNEEVDNGRAGAEMFYRNVLIEGNTIYNDHSHGITVGETAGLTIRNNSVLHADGAEPGVGGSVSVPKINVAGTSTDVTIVNNLAGGISTAGGQPTWTVANNLIVQDSDQSAPNHYTDLFVSATLQATDGGNGFLALPGGLIETMDIGPDRLRIDETPAQITPLFHVTTLPADSSVFVFDGASATYGPLGAITPGLGTFLWDFGDGSTATGGVVTHRYAAPGSYPVTVSVVQPDGTTVSKSALAVASPSDLLRLDTTTGSFGITSDTGETLIALSATRLVETAGEFALDLGKSGVSVPRAKIEDLFGADNFALDLRLQADSAQSYGEVVRLHSTFIATVNQTGQFVFQLTTTDGKGVTLTSTGANLLDGASHDISIRFDVDLGVLTLSVDGGTTVSAPVAAELPSMGSWDLSFGNPWGKRNFDGQLQKFDLDVDRSNYAVYDGVLPPVALPVPEAPVTEPDAMPPNGYTLDGAAMAGLDPAALQYDTRLVQEGGQTVLAFDGKGDRAVLGTLAQFEAAEQLALAVEFRGDKAGNPGGCLLSSGGQISLTVVKDGFKLCVAAVEDGVVEIKKYNIANLGLADTDRHEAVILFDTVSDQLQIFLDDSLVFEERGLDLVMTSPEGGAGGGWVLGQGFRGTISEFRIDDDIASPFWQSAVGTDLTVFV